MALFPGLGTVICESSIPHKHLILSFLGCVRMGKRGSAVTQCSVRCVYSLKPTGLGSASLGPMLRWPSTIVGSASAELMGRFEVGFRVCRGTSDLRGQRDLRGFACARTSCGRSC